MGKVSFLTAVSFGDQPRTGMQSCLETVDNYFYLGGKKAYVIPGHVQGGRQGAVLTEDSSRMFVTALKVISYLTVAIPVVMLIAKTVLRSIYRFHVIDVSSKVEEGIDVSDEISRKIGVLARPIAAGQDHDEIIWYPGKMGQRLTFRLTSIPHLIFKRVNYAAGRFENMVKAQEVCLAHQLGLLMIPHAKKFNMQGMNFIAEQYLEHKPEQETLYATLPGLNKTVKQLTTFIAKTGFGDVEWRNMPIVDSAPDFSGPRRIALVDLEEMGDAKFGIFGAGDVRRGLIRCLFSAKQMDIALAEAQRWGIVHSDFSPAQIKQMRMDEVRRTQELRDE